MANAIFFLGTGGDAVVVGKNQRSAGGIIVKTGETQLHIDPGPGALIRANELGLNLRETTAVLVSHAHVNHSAELNAVISAMTYNGLDVHGVLVANETVLNGSGKLLPVLSEFHKKCIEKVLMAKPGTKLGIENTEIELLNANHSDSNTVGFKIFTPKFVLCYTSDTEYSKEIAMQYKKCDILIMNTVYPPDSKEKDHLSTDDAVRMIKLAKPKLAVITHFGTKLHSQDPVQHARVIQKMTGIQTIAAQDGTIINPVSYSAELKQKTLGGFTVEEQQRTLQGIQGSEKA